MGQQDVREVVRQLAVVLLRHRLVEAAQSRLEMGDRDVELDGGERGGERRVDVARDDDEVGRLVEQELLDRDERPRRLLAVRAGPHAEELVGLRHPELVEEHLRHALVVVLARVHEAQLDLGGLLLERPVNRGDLHEVRPCADKEMDAGHSAHSAQTAPTRKPVHRSGSAAVSSKA